MSDNPTEPIDATDSAPVQSAAPAASAAPAESSAPMTGVVDPASHAATPTFVTTKTLWINPQRKAAFLALSAAAGLALLGAGVVAGSVVTHHEDRHVSRFGGPNPGGHSHHMMPRLGAGQDQQGAYQYGYGDVPPARGGLMKPYGKQAPGAPVPGAPATPGGTTTSSPTPTPNG